MFRIIVAIIVIIARFLPSGILALFITRRQAAPVEAKSAAAEPSHAA